MNISRKTIVAFIAAASLALGVGVANAQGYGWGGCGGGGGPYYGNCGGWGGCGGGGGGWGGHHYGGCGWGGCAGGNYGGRWNQEFFKDRMEARHERLKDFLKITPKQEAAWNTFNEQMLALAEERGEQMARFDPAEFANLTMPERMEKRQELARRFQDSMDKRLATLKTFYASLTAEQKELFDDWHSPRRWRDDWRDGKKDGKTSRKDGQKSRKNNK